VTDGERDADREQQGPDALRSGAARRGRFDGAPGPAEAGVRSEMPGMVVADIASDTGVSRTAPARESEEERRRARRRGQEQAIVRISPSAVDFGTLRKGETRQLKLQARVDGARGAVAGRIFCAADWITATPAGFNRTRQTITVIADSGRTWETGDFEDSLRIETNVGACDVPIRLRVAPPRPTFWQVAAWFLPLLCAALLPVAVVAEKAGGRTDAALLGMLIPTATLASALLTAMLFLVTLAADLGIAERICCGLLTVSLFLLLGIRLGAPMSATLQNILVPRMLAVGGVLGSALILQLGSLSRWKLWAIALGCLGLCAGFGFLYAV
jgi:hypothetical protein